MSIILVSVAIIICILLSAYFSAAEMALSSCNTVRLNNISEEKSKNYKKARKALKVTENFDNTLSAILIGNNLANIAASSLSSVLLILVMHTDKYAWASTLILTLLIIIFSETIPKMMAKKCSTTFSMKCAGTIEILTFIFKPVIWIVVALVNLITMCFKSSNTVEDSEESVEELQSIIETAEEEGIIDEDDSNIMQAAIDFSEISASEVMTARIDVIAIDIDDSWSEILSSIESSPYSRIPVYQNSIDNVIGILHLNKFYKVLSEIDSTSSFDLRSILMQPCYVYKTMKLPKVLNTLKSAKQHLAIVTDEYSGTLGVISMEDVLEQLVGEIYDETDVIEPEIVKHNDNEFEIDGDLSISEFIETVGLDEDTFEAESETAGGLTVEILGHFPTVGEEFNYQNLNIKVLVMDGRRVEKLLVSIKGQENS